MKTRNVIACCLLVMLNPFSHAASAQDANTELGARPAAEQFPEVEFGAETRHSDQGLSD